MVWINRTSVTKELQLEARNMYAVYDRFENFLKLGKENVNSMKNTAPWQRQPRFGCSRHWISLQARMFKTRQKYSHMRDKFERHHRVDSSLAKVNVQEGTGTEVPAKASEEKFRKGHFLTEGRDQIGTRRCAWRSPWHRSQRHSWMFLAAPTHSLRLTTRFNTYTLHAPRYIPTQLHTSRRLLI
jgi:hypothetical protein